MAVPITNDYVDQKILANPKRPLVFGVSGPQGSGKSYLAKNLVEHVTRKHKLSAVSILVDDFYLTHADQLRVTADAKQLGNHVLCGRGLPGTHDMALAVQTMRLLLAGEETAIPRYDKSAFGGEGDRCPASDWPVVCKPDVIVVEGWLNGFKAIDEESFVAAYMANDPAGIVQRTAMVHFAELNRALALYSLLWDTFDYFVCLETVSLDEVYGWRLQQEEELRRERGAGLTPAQVTAFVDRYMPMYHMYYWRMCKEGSAPKDCNLRLKIDKHRDVVSVAEF